MRRAAAILTTFGVVAAAWGCDGTSTPRPTAVMPSAIWISPDHVTAGSSDLQLTITGSEFLGNGHRRSRVIWSVAATRTQLATTFLNSTELTATVPATLLASPGTAQVSVETGDPMSDGPPVVTRPAPFRVTGSAPAPIAVSPTSTLAGSRDLQLTVAGSGFVDGHHFRSSVVWDAAGSENFLTTTFVSNTQLTAVVPASLLEKRITAEVLVETGDSMGDVPFIKSQRVIFTVK